MLGCVCLILLVAVVCFGIAFLDTSCVFVHGLLVWACAACVLFVLCFCLRSLELLCLLRYLHASV